MPNISLWRKRDFNRLSQVSATIVSEMNDVGIYHFNKLTYLFEYFFIKNFGAKLVGFDRDMFFYD